MLVVLLAATLASAAWTSGLGRLALYLSGALIGVAFAVGIIASRTGHPVTGSLYILGAALVVTSVGIIGLGVFDQRAVNLQAVLGAISAYVLLGLLFTCIYGVDGRARLRPALRAGHGRNAFRSASTSATSRSRPSATATTRCRANLGHTIAVLEALIGQLYLVTVVATLVSRMPGRGSSRAGSVRRKPDERRRGRSTEPSRAAPRGAHLRIFVEMPAKNSDRGEQHDRQHVVVRRVFACSADRAASAGGASSADAPRRAQRPVLRHRERASAARSGSSADWSPARRRRPA